MKILATIKPVNFSKNKNNYAILTELDFDNKTVLRSLKIPAASFHTSTSFMTNFAQGLAIDYQNKKIYVGYWNFIVIVDYKTFTIEDCISHPLMADVHGLSFHKNKLYITSTAIDSLLIYDLTKRLVTFRWGSGSKLFSNKSILLSRRLPKILRKSNIISKIYHKYGSFVKFGFTPEEYRSLHKSRTFHHHHHLNDVLVLNENEVLLTTKGWNNFEDGTVIKLNPRTNEAKFLLKPGNAKGIHDCILSDKKIYFTESSRNRLGWLNENNVYSSLKVEETPYFIRGLCKINNQFIVGFSTLRNTSNPCKIVAYDNNFHKLNSFDIDFFYPKEIGTAVHAICKSPE